jgi:NADH-quinone oxidoreductase subunit J
MNAAQLLSAGGCAGWQIMPWTGAAGGLPSVGLSDGTRVWLAIGAVISGVVALCLLLPATTHRRYLAGAVLGMLSILLVLTGIMLPLAPFTAEAVFWALAIVTVVAAVAAIATVKPVYTVLWFALSLLGTAGLLLYDGAQFLSVSTMAVYAGAILVTFLFVVMLAQPEGHAAYDRITWSWYTKSAATLVAALLVSVLTIAINGAAATVTPRAELAAQSDVLQPAHMARLGGELFGKHLLSVEIAGALLLVALVGAVSIMIQAGQSPGAPPEETER